MAMTNAEKQRAYRERERRRREEEAEELKVFIKIKQLIEEYDGDDFELVDELSSIIAPYLIKTDKD